MSSVGSGSTQGDVFYGVGAQGTAKSAHGSATQATQGAGFDLPANARCTALRVRCRREPQ